MLGGRWAWRVCGLGVCGVIACGDEARRADDTRTVADVADAAGEVGADDVANAETSTVEEVAEDAGDAAGPEVEVRPVDDGLIDWARLQYPAEHRGEVGSAVVIYGRVFEEGVTPGALAGPGIEGEVGLGIEGAAVEAWVWTAANFSIDVDDAINDEYAAVLELPAPGTYRYGFRFRRLLPEGPGPWLLADLNGSDDGFDVLQAGRLEVVDAKPQVVDWCRLEGPSPLVVAPGGLGGPVRGRVYEQGVTERAPEGEAQIVAEVGVGEGDIAGWRWWPAAYARQLGNDQEFEAMIEAPPFEGERRVAYRFRLAGRETWTYCDLAGGDGFDVSAAGILKIEIPPVDAIDHAALRPAELSWVSGQMAPEVEVIVYEQGRTTGPGAGSGIGVEVGIGSSEAGLLWIPATYRGDEDGLGELDNDVYVARLPDEMPVGQHAWAARVTLANGEVTWVDATGTGDGYDPERLGRVTVRAAVQIVECVFDAPSSVEVAPEVRVGPLRVWIEGAEGVSFDGVTAEVELGYGPAGTAPEGGSWSFAGGLMAEGIVEGRWRFSGDLVAPREEGLWDVGARVRLREGEKDWVQCDRDGSANGQEVAQRMRLKVEVPRVDYCRIQYPTEAVVVTAGADTPLLFGVVYEPGVTGDGGSGAVNIISEVGFGPEGTRPDDQWRWARGTFNLFADNGFGQWSNDEHRGVLRPESAGQFAWAWRFSLDGLHWRVCDEAGSDEYDPLRAGLLIVE